MLLLTFPSLFFLSNKQEPRHLQLLSDLEDSNIFTIITGRKLHNSPTDYQFCIKVTLMRKHCNLSNSINPLLKTSRTNLIELFYFYPASPTNPINNLNCIKCRQRLMTGCLVIFLKTASPFYTLCVWEGACQRTQGLKNPTGGKHTLLVSGISQDGTGPPNPWPLSLTHTETHTRTHSRPAGVSDAVRGGDSAGFGEGFDLVAGLLLWWHEWIYL